MAAVIGFYACNDAGEGSTTDTDTSANNSAAPDHTAVTPATGDTSSATAAGAQPLDKDATEFVTEAASGGMLEVELGQLAQQNASNPRVKEFGAMMVRDHSKANDELKQITGHKNVVLPTTLIEKHQHHKDDLSKKQGAEFDKAYMKMMVDDHQGDISKFEKTAKNSTDADLKAFAAKTLPVLNVHLDSAKAVRKSLK